jgi:hypothetical protein
MLRPRKAFSHLLVALLAIGGLNCPCPANATGEPVSHGNHESHHQPAADSDHCDHGNCVSDCAGLAADHSRHDMAFPGTAGDRFDDFGAPQAETAAWPRRAAPAAWSGPPLPIRAAFDTPVQRFDRLLD